MQLSFLLLNILCATYYFLTINIHISIMYYIDILSKQHLSKR